MDREPIANPKEDVSNQERLKDIFGAIGTLSQDGKESIAGNIRYKIYTPPNAINWNNLTDIFIAQLTEKGKQKFPKLQVRNVALNFQGRGIESVDYKIYKEDDSFRIEKQENVRMERPLNVPKNISEALEGAVKTQQARMLEKKLGYTKVDAAETQKLLDLLNDLIKQKRIS